MRGLFRDFLPRCAALPKNRMKNWFRRWRGVQLSQLVYKCTIYRVISSAKRSAASSLSPRGDKLCRGGSVNFGVSVVLVFFFVVVSYTLVYIQRDAWVRGEEKNLRLSATRLVNRITGERRGDEEEYYIRRLYRRVLALSPIKRFIHQPGTRAVAYKLYLPTLCSTCRQRDFRRMYIFVGLVHLNSFSLFFFSLLCRRVCGHLCRRDS